MADPNAVEIVRLRNEFYRDNYRKAVAVLLLAIMIIAVLMGTLFYVISHPPKPKYFATDSTGRLMPLIPLNKPNMSNAAVLQWANTAGIAAFSYNFANYRQELQAASEFFTPTGWQSFMKTLEETNNLKAVIDRKLVVSAVATGAPRILKQEVIEPSGRYAWRIRMPVNVSYENINQSSQQQLILTMLIVRMSILNSADGIGIAQLIATEQTAPTNNAGT